MNASQEFQTKAAALAHLRSNPQACVTWYQAGGRYSAIYWNGRRKIVPAHAKYNWTTGRESG